MSGQRILLGQASEIPPGTMQIVSLDGQPVLLVNTGGRILAVQSTCTHEAEPLIDGYLTDSTLVCAYHGSEFDLETGEAIGPPAEDPLTVYPLVIENDQIFGDPAAG